MLPREAAGGIAARRRADGTHERRREGIVHRPASLHRAVAIGRVGVADLAAVVKRQGRTGAGVHPAALIHGLVAVNAAAVVQFHGHCARGVHPAAIARRGIIPAESAAAAQRQPRLTGQVDAAAAAGAVRIRPVANVAARLQGAIKQKDEKPAEVRS